jgi:hypothetical protein
MRAARSSCSLLISGVKAGRLVLLLLVEPPPAGLFLRLRGSNCMRPCFGAAAVAVGLLLDVDDEAAVVAAVLPAA